MRMEEFQGKCLAGKMGSFCGYHSSHNYQYDKLWRSWVAKLSCLTSEKVFYMRLYMEDPDYIYTLSKQSLTWGENCFQHICYSIFLAYNQYLSFFFFFLPIYLNLRGGHQMGFRYNRC